MKYLLIILFIVSCKDNPLGPDLIGRVHVFKKTNPYFEVLRQDFESDYFLYKDANIDTSEVYINFTTKGFFDKSPRSYIYCYRDRFGGLDIIINSNYWDGLSSSCLKVIIYQELNYCYFGVSDRNTGPSIMNSNINNYCEDFVNNDDLFLKELFLDNPINSNDLI